MKKKLIQLYKHPRKIPELLFFRIPNLVFVRIPIAILTRLPYFSFIKHTSDYQCPNDFNTWFYQKVLNIGGNRSAYWPVHFTSKIVNPRNIYAGIDTSPGMMGGCYIQGIGKIYIGDYTQIASNVSIISANHDLHDSRKHIPENVRIGKYCWIGAGAVILPGVELGDFSIVGAGTIVTKSFKDGYCVIVGNPAKKIKDLDKTLCHPYKNRHSYNGYISSEKFASNPRKYINI